MEQLRLPWPVILASASPRRRELLKQIVESFEVIPANIDEKSILAIDAMNLAALLARRKAETVIARRKDAMVIGADTIVVLDAEVLNKPVDESEAKRMLTVLSGRTHVVITGLALFWADQSIVVTPWTKVTFRKLTSKEIDAYVATGEPMDKAGAYAIQGGAAGFVTDIEGDRNTVVGLPVDLLREFLSKIANGTGAP